MEEIDAQISAEKAAGTIDQDAGTDLGGPEGGFGEPVGQFDDDDDDFPDADDTPPGTTPRKNGNGNGSQNRNL